jgi:hypothetical protein
VRLTDKATLVMSWMPASSVLARLSRAWRRRRPHHITTHRERSAVHGAWKYVVGGQQGLGQACLRGHLGRHLRRELGGGLGRQRLHQ